MLSQMLWLRSSNAKAVAQALAAAPIHPWPMNFHMLGKKKKKKKKKRKDLDLGLNCKNGMGLSIRSELRVEFAPL